MDKNIRDILIFSGIVIASLVAYVIYDNKKNSLKAKIDDKGEVDMTGMEKYTLKFPFKYQQDLSKYYESIGDIGYSHVSDSVNTDNDGIDYILINIMAKPNQISEINRRLMSLNKEIRTLKFEE